MSVCVIFTHLPQVNQQFYAPASYYNQQFITSQTSQPTQPLTSTHIEASTSQAGQTSQTSISDMLAAASERVLERCSLEYDETAGMCYNANSALYYDQVHVVVGMFLPISVVVLLSCDDMYICSCMR